MANNCSVVKLFSFQMYLKSEKFGSIEFYAYDGTARSNSGYSALFEHYIRSAVGAVLSCSKSFSGQHRAALYKSAPILAKF